MSINFDIEIDQDNHRPILTYARKSGKDESWLLSKNKLTELYNLIGDYLHIDVSPQEMAKLLDARKYMTKREAIAYVAGYYKGHTIGAFTQYLSLSLPTESLETMKKAVRMLEREDV